MSLLSHSFCCFWCETSFRVKNGMTHSFNLFQLFFLFLHHLINFEKSLSWDWSLMAFLMRRGTPFFFSYRTGHWNNDFDTITWRRLLAAVASSESWDCLSWCFSNCCCQPSCQSIRMNVCCWQYCLKKSYCGHKKKRSSCHSSSCPQMTRRLSQFLGRCCSEIWV